MITLSLLKIIICNNIIINVVRVTITFIITVISQLRTHVIPHIHSPRGHTPIQHEYIKGSDCAEHIFYAKLCKTLGLPNRAQINKQVQTLPISSGTEHVPRSDCGLYHKYREVSFPLETRYVLSTYRSMTLVDMAPGEITSPMNTRARTRVMITNFTGE